MSNIVKKESTELTAPEYLKQYKGEGAEDITADLIEKSFLQMAHEPKEGVAAGEWYDSATNQTFGDSVIITVCKIQRSWRLFNSDFQLEKQSVNGMHWDDGKLLNEDEKWQCAFIDMFVLINGSDTSFPYIISFKSTSFRTGKKLATAIAKFTKGNGEPIFARNYTLYTEEEKKGTKSYYVSKYKINPGFNSEDMINTAAKVRNMVLDITPVMSESDKEPESDFTEGLD